MAARPAQHRGSGGWVARLLARVVVVVVVVVVVAVACCSPQSTKGGA